MLLLAFETSAKAASVALFDDRKLLGEQYQNTGLTHSQTLMVMAEDLLKQCGKTVADITAVAVAEGPGSFTGVRIGVAAAKGFAWGGQLPCYGVSTLEAMAESLGIYEGYVCPCMDARRSQVYNALFRAENGKLTRITEDRAIALKDLKEELKNLEKQISNDFPKPAACDYEIRYVPEQLESSLSPAFYLTAPLDNTDRNVIYINNGSTDSSDSLSMVLRIKVCREE